MPEGKRNTAISSPKRWSSDVKAAVLQVISLAQFIEA
jgi:hypothetical protein